MFGHDFGHDVGARKPFIMVSELWRLSIFSWDGSLLTWPYKTIQGECSDLFGVTIASDDDVALRLYLPIVGSYHTQCIFKF